MTECVMYNMILGNYHPSTICVEMSKLEDSLNALSDIIDSEYIEDEMQEFISRYARTDEIMPEDKTVGFIVVHRDKKNFAISINKNDKRLADSLIRIAQKFASKGFRVDTDIAGLEKNE
jgi:hypothetical protein